jgi:microcompartment protein CcmL/EutN
MHGYALGLIETRGKLAAIEAADVALKAANVALCGVENATGALITVKVVGDVGAVRAAVDAAKAKASLLGEVVAAHVLPRPATGIMPMIKAVPVSATPESSAESIDSTSPTTGQAHDGEERGQDTELSPESVSVTEEGDEPAPAPLPSEEAALVEDAPETVVDEAQAATCNICNDPACPRKKGEPSRECMHSTKKRSK